jgi:hypothetical protein
VDNDLRCHVEVRGWYLLVALRGRRDVGTMAALLAAAVQLRDRVPTVVWELYPRAGEPGWLR